MVAKIAMKPGIQNAGRTSNVRFAGSIEVIVEQHPIECFIQMAVPLRVAVEAGSEDGIAANEFNIRDE